MIQAYNLLVSLPVKREVLYPAKSRGELKRVYDNIVSLNSRSPLFKLNLSKENQEYTIGIKETALELKDRLNEMQDPEITGFKSKAVFVSDESVLSARLLNENTETLPETIQIKVTKLADVQVNRGKDLLNSSFALPMGKYDFSVQVGDETYQLSYNHEQRISNLDALKNLTEYINNTVPGINALVERGKSKDYSKIAIAANMTGRFGDKKFVFDEDDSYGEGVVDFFGLNRVEKEAAYSDFELNGVPKQTATNTFNLENTLQISLNGISDKPVTLKVTQDSNKILTAVGSVINTYNGLIKLAKQRIENNKEHYSADKLLNELQSLENVYQGELEKVGITVCEDGMLSFDEPTAIMAAQDGGMESFFTKRNGFIARLIDKAEAIAINPVNYLEKTVILYPNNDKPVNLNPYVTSMYSGMLFNSYC